MTFFHHVISVLLLCVFCFFWQTEECFFGKTFGRKYPFLTSCSHNFPIFRNNNKSPSTSINFSLISKAESSVYLKWRRQNSTNYEGDISYNLKYRANNPDWISIVYDEDELDIFNNELRVNITGLYPNTKYEFMLFTKTVEEPNDYWRFVDSITITTKDCAPYRPPITDIGSFRVENFNNDTRTVRIFWQPLPEIEHNGFGFHYKIQIFEEDNLLDETITWSNEGQLVKELTLKAHRIIIRSANYIGASINSSIVHIPAQKNIITSPMFIALDLGSGIYEFAWKVWDLDDVTNITMFSCESRNQTCGTIERYIHLPKNKTSFVKELGFHSSLAISVNSATSSSGMCQPILVTKIENLGEMSASPKINVRDTRIELIWPLLHPIHGLVKGVQGYNVFFCAVENNNCGNQKHQFIVPDFRPTLHALIPELEPDRMYKIYVYVIMEDGSKGPRSADVYVRTLKENT